MYRRSGGRVIGGVAGGVADHLGVDVTRVRIVFTLLTLLGVGAVGYALLWFLCPQGSDTAPPSAAERRRALGMAILGVLGAVLLAGLASSSDSSFVVPIVVVAVGAALVWREADTAPRDLGTRLVRPSRARALTWARMLGGATLVVVGLGVVLLGHVTVATLRTSLLAVVVTLVGATLLTVPVWVRLWRDLGEERAARVRTAEREEIASHLHDSVLQTLALIQRQADDAGAVKRLARGQERELREWLFGERAEAATSLAAALQVTAGDVEDSHGIRVALVTVGDVGGGAAGGELGADDRFTALLGATREALVNAAKHSGCESVDLFAEVGDDAVRVFVRDRGVGFDPATVPSDRQGLAGSVRGRIERRGGTVTVKSSPGRGTEVGMTMPRGAAQRSEAESA
ncbi:ATP-binding protein [Tsukamurella soli]|uniref:ATP-binding protein n=1 Tax=Tsukamurella soli TaxID=644556 RepID=A0ABP8KFL8_9ACTN